MSSFIKHIPCPKCHSRDNRGVYTDGHEWCWGCHDYLPPQDIRYIPKVIEDIHSTSLNLPYDCTKDIPITPLKWLKQYGLSNKEIIDNHYVWSGSRELLIAKVLSSQQAEGGDDEDLILWQGRYFGSDPNVPKNFNKGRVSETLYIIGNGEPLVLVEDLVSAIKVGRQTSCMVLFGSGIDTGRLYKLSKRFKYLKVWNDMDKLDEARKTAKKASQFDFEDITVIQTDLDPKCYSDMEIKEWLFSK